MKNLETVCQSDAIDTMTVSALRSCMDSGAFFSIGWVEGIILGVATLLAVVWGAGFGHKKLAAALEGLYLAPLAVYAAAFGALFFVKWLPPIALGVWFSFQALSGLVLLVIALINGTAKAGWKVLGTVLVLLYCATCAGVAVLAFLLPSGPAPEAFSLYMNLIIWLLMITALVEVLFAAAHGSYHFAAGWFLVPLNASWGALGNLGGVLHHLLSWHCFADHGKPVRDSRVFYTNYKSGLRLRYGSNPFAFTQGAVMTGPPVETHESQHVLQHFIFGPIFVISYVAWFVPAGIIGFFVGLAKKMKFMGVEAWAYFNNPWEIWAYAVEGGRSQGGDVRLIWGSAASWVVACSYYLIAIAAFVLTLAVHYGVFD